MSVSIDVTGLATDQYLFRASPLAELGSALHLLVEPAHHAQQTGWIAATGIQIEPDVMDRVVAADYLWRTSRSDMLLPAYPQGTLVAELDALDDLDDETWCRTALLTSSCGVVDPRDDLGSPLVSEAARRVVTERAAARGSRQAEFVEQMLVAPGATRTWVRRLLEDCQTSFFADAWNRIVPRLEDDARLKRDLLDRKGLGRALAAISPALTLADSGGRIVVDKLQDRTATAREAGLTFLPSAFCHPHLLVVYARGRRPVIHYPMLSSPSDGLVSVGDVQRRLHALDHPMRLRLLRSIIRGPQTTAQLADQWLLTPPEVSRHLAVLKDAGIIVSTRRGRYVAYTFDLAGNARIGTDLIQALLR